MTSCRTNTGGESRGLRVFAAWLNHVDTKAENSLDTLIAVGTADDVGHIAPSSRRSCAATCTCDHDPPRGAGIPRLVRARAMARWPVMPSANSASRLGGPRPWLGRLPSL